jgi:alcohol dehydrogenase class IV
MGAEEKNTLFLRGMKKLDETLGIPKKLSSFGLKEKDVSFMIEQCGVLQKTIENNPVPIKNENLREILCRLL